MKTLQQEAQNRADRQPTTSVRYERPVLAPTKVPKITPLSFGRGGMGGCGFPMVTAKDWFQPKN